MANTVEETNNLIEEAYHDAIRAQTKLDWVLSGAPRTAPYATAREAARAAHRPLGEAIDVLRSARVTAAGLHAAIARRNAKIANEGPAR